MYFNITIPIQSSIANAAAFLVIDIACALAISSAISALHSHLILRYLRQHNFVIIRHFDFGPLSIAFLHGKKLSSLLLSLGRLFLVLILFLLTLGINGRSLQGWKRIKRSYISQLKFQGNANTNIRPQLFSICTEYNEPELLYYPLAFNLLGNASESPDDPTKNENGALTSIKSDSVVCQQFFEPLLTAHRCGSNAKECCNVILSQPFDVKLHIIHNVPHWDISTIDGNFGEKEEVLFIRANVTVERGFRNSDARLLCLHFSRSNSKNCCLGQWNAERTRFAFTLANITFDGSPRDFKDTQLKIQTFSYEIELEWNSSRHTEDLFGPALHALAGNVAPARMFLDMLVSRNSRSVEVREQEIFEPDEQEGTDVSSFTVVGYIIILLASTIVALVRLCHLVSRKQRVGDLTVLDGWKDLLRECREKCKYYIALRSSGFVVTAKRDFELLDSVSLQ